MSILNINTDFNKYRFFYAVAEYKSFSKAAENLFISQPAISHAIKELEEQLGIKLFNRDNKNVMLTEDGEKLLYYIKEAFDNILLGERIIKEKVDDLNGTIRIGIYSHISMFMLPKTIKRFNEKHPNANFTTYSTSNMEMLEKLRNNELDFVILQYPIFLNEHTFKEEVLCELETCFFANKNYYDLYMNCHDSIVNYPLIMPTRGYSDINNLEEIFKKHNLIIKKTHTNYCTELTKEFVKEGIGIGWGLRKCVEKDIKNNELYEIPVDFKMPTTKFSIAYNPIFLNKTTLEFIYFLKEDLQKIDINYKKNN